MDRDDAGPLHQRHLRAELRDARKRRHLTQQEVAEALGWSSSKLIRIETGQVGVSQTDLRALLSQYGVTDEEQIKSLTAIARRSRHQPWRPYRDVLKSEFITYLGYEGEAAAIRQYHPLLIPGLLQTEEYASAVIRAFAPADASETLLDRQLEWRMARQATIRRPDAPRMAFVVDECAVRRPGMAGAEGRDLMRRQLEHLKEIAGPSITIQILPLSHGIHPGLANPFVILTFHNDKDGDLLYLENSRGSTTLRGDNAEVARYREIFDGLTAAATKPDDLPRAIDSLYAAR